MCEIHEMAKAKGRKFERLPASAGTKGVGDLPTKPHEESPKEQKKRAVGGVRHSLNMPGYGSASLEIQAPNGAAMHRRGSGYAVEDSLISATSVNEPGLGSAPLFDDVRRGAPRTRNLGRRGQTVGARSGHGQQYVSNSMMASHD